MSTQRPAPLPSEIFADDGVTPRAIERLRAAAAFNIEFYGEAGPRPDRVLLRASQEDARIAATRHGAVALLLGRAAGL